MIKKKGFTLIELLAVIIILAVIALIATPIVLNVLEKSQEEARKNSVIGFADAVKLSYTEELMDNTGKPLEELATLKIQGNKVECEYVKYDTEKYGTLLHNCSVNEKGNYCYINGRVYNSDSLECENVLSIIEGVSPTYTKPIIEQVSQNPEGTTYAQSRIIRITYLNENNENLKYYYSLDGSTWTEVTSTTKDLTFTENGRVYAKMEDEIGKMVTSTFNVINIDTIAPTVTVEVLDSIATFTITDNLSAVGYGVSQSSSESPNYITFDGTTSTTKTWTASDAGTYYVWVKDEAGNENTAMFTISSTNFCSYEEGYTWKFDYIGDIQNFVVPCNGTYKLKAYGAQGEDGYGQYDSTKEIGKGANGSYISGNIDLSENDILYINVGSSTGYNGGGTGGGTSRKCYYDWGLCGEAYSGTGGGSTDVRITGIELSNRIIVAGGGAGGSGSGGWNVVTKGNIGNLVPNSNSVIHIGSSGTSSCDSNAICTAVGAGGGGYYGGIAGYSGTNYFNNNHFANVTIETGVNEGNGYVEIIYQPDDIESQTIVWEYDYVEKTEMFVAPYDGTYTIEAFAPSGGTGTYVNTSTGICSHHEQLFESGNYGSHVKSDFTLTKGTILYIVAGGQGKTGNTVASEITTCSTVNGAGGYNGGTQGTNGGGGGGATHIAKKDGLITDLTTSDLYLSAKGGTGQRALNYISQELSNGIGGGSNYISSIGVNSNIGINNDINSNGRVVITFKR